MRGEGLEMGLRKIEWGKGLIGKCWNMREFGVIEIMFGFCRSKIGFLKVKFWWVLIIN